MIEALRIPLPEDDRDLDPSRRQQKVSDPSASVWVNASAGSGKTTVLTNRVVRLLLSGVKPERILCLTFTKAAAAEMSIRITQQLSKWATCSDDELRNDLDGLQGEAPFSEQLTRARRLFAQVLCCPGGMRIRTIHAFCQEILQRFPIEANVPPHFAVIEEAEAFDLQTCALKELLREADAKPDMPIAQALRFLVTEQGEYHFTSSMRDILGERARLEAAIAKAGGLDKLIAEMRRQLGLSAQDTPPSIKAAFCADISETSIKQLGQWLLECSKKFSERGQRILDWLSLSAPERIAHFDDYARCFLKEDGSLYVSIANKDALAKNPNIQVFFDREAQRMVEIHIRLEAAQIVATTAALLTFGHELIQHYEAHKKLQAVMDYDDLIARADRLLRRPGIAPWVLYKLDGGLEHILVDEAQDTSRAQWNIVSVLADEFFTGASARSDANRTLFVVGDEKQSIFSFQRADPEAFAEMHGYFAQRILNAGKTYREVPMRMSFRSAPAILRAVDKVFEADKVRSGVSVEPVVHQAFDDRKTVKIGRVEIWPLLPKPVNDAEADSALWQLPLGYETERDSQAELAQQIARKIKYLIDDHVLAGTNRQVEPSDIMILLRRRGRFADLMVRALKELRIPVTGVDRMNLVKQLPVMDLLSFMQFVLLPEDDLNLATLLRGPLLNISEDQLMTLAMGREGSLWRRLVEYAERDDAFAAAHEYLAAWLNRADFLTPFAMLAELLNESCPGSAVSGRHALWSRLGTDALDPIEELLNAAQNFSQRYTPSLQNFLHWLMATEAEIKREQDRGAGQVRIMTVHASKGLEAPIVFLPDTTSIPSAQSLPPFQWGDDDIPLYLPHKPMAGLPRQRWDDARRKQLEEYRRLLYVALTRSARYLYICGWEPTHNAGNADESWYNIAQHALAEMHQSSSILPESQPQPVIAFADVDIHGRSETKPITTSVMPLPLLPSWALTAPVFESDEPRYIVPSRLTQSPASVTPDQAFARGRIIHRLLQSLPKVADDQRDAVAAHFLANPKHNLSPVQQTSIAKEVLSLLQHSDYAFLFNAQSKAEVPLVGHVHGKLVSGQVDRLYIGEDAVWIVDYKTNRPPPGDVADVPAPYLMQLASYRAVLQAVYPDKPIRCFLLWTYAPRLMELPDSLMQPLLQQLGA